MKIRHKAPYSHQECDHWLQVRALSSPGKIPKKGERNPFLGVSPDRGDAVALLFALGGLHFAELRLVIGHCLREDREEGLCVLWGDADDSFCPGLVDARDLVQEDEGEFVFFIGDLDHIAVYRVQGVGNIDRDLMRCHASTVGMDRVNPFRAQAPAGTFSGAFRAGTRVHAGFKPARSNLHCMHPLCPDDIHVPRERAR